MTYQLAFSDQARRDFIFHKKAGNKGVLTKIQNLLEDTAEHPFEGIGKPELLKYDLSDKWPRRINKEHRLFYEVVENQILVHSLKGHYL